MRSLGARVLDNVRRHRLWSPGDRVAVAVSGGRDSIVLVHALASTAGEHGARLSVVTVDHGTRPESAVDADFVAHTADRLGLPLARFDLSLGATASEATCRAARYAAFSGLDVDRVALAHHRADQAETMIVALLRGTGPRGLVGMRWRRGRYVRPMLDLDRETVASGAEGLVWREDASNADPRFLRNRVRREVLPLLEDLRPGAVTAIARSAAAFAELSDMVDDLAAAVPRDEDGWELSILRSLPGPVLDRVIRDACPAATAPHLTATRRLVAEGRGRTQLPGGITLAVTAGRVCLVRPSGSHALADASGVRRMEPERS